MRGPRSSPFFHYEETCGGWRCGGVYVPLFEGFFNIFLHSMFFWQIGLNMVLRGFGFCKQFYGTIVCAMQ